MPIQIIDGFKLGTSRPIDDRIVGSGSSYRDNITYKYDGLLVVDTSDHKPYIWNSTGLTWSIVESTNNNNNNNGSGSSITEITSNSKKYYYIGTNPTVVNTTTDLSLNITGGLNVSGDIKISNGKFFGDGNSITNINPGNISNAGGSADQVLQLIGNSLTPTWTTISSNKITTALVDHSKNYFIGFIENPPTDVSVIRNKRGVGIQNNVFYLTDGVGLSASVGTFSRVFITGLSASVGTFSTVFSNSLSSTGLTASVATFSRVFSTNLDTSVGTIARAAITDLKVSRAATFSSIFLTTGAFDNKVLMSDADGKASWSNIPDGSPVGTIIIWSWVASLPYGYKNCNGAGFIFAKNQDGTYSYYQIPSFSDRIISGVTTYGAIGSYPTTGQSPTTAGSIKIDESNLPKHKHSPGTLNITSSGTHEHQLWKGGNGGGQNSDIYAPGDLKNYQRNTLGTGNHTHPSSSFSGSTGDGGFANSPIALPIIKGMKVIFLIKFDPKAIEGQVGHYTLNKIPNASYTYRTITGDPI